MQYSERQKHDAASAYRNWRTKKFNLTCIDDDWNLFGSNTKGNVTRVGRVKCGMVADE